MKKLLHNRREIFESPNILEENLETEKNNTVFASGYHFNMF